MTSVPNNGPNPPMVLKESAGVGAAAGNKIPLWLKVLYTAFVAVLVPYYWKAYGPANFLYFCDVALLLTLVAMWLESPFLASLQGVAILLPQTLWVIDFAVGAFGGTLIGMTDYMFDPKLPLFVRGLSAFHGWLPFLLVWLIWRLGYDRRAFVAQVVLGMALLMVCYLFAPAPPAPPADPNAAVNINYVYGLRNDVPQSWMPALAWLALLMVAFPVGMYLPTHLVLRKLFPPARRREPSSLPAITSAPVIASVISCMIVGCAASGCERQSTTAPAPATAPAASTSVSTVKVDTSTAVAASRSFVRALEHRDAIAMENVLRPDKDGTPSERAAETLQGTGKLAGLAATVGTGVKVIVSDTSNPKGLEDGQEVVTVSLDLRLPDGRVQVGAGVLEVFKVGDAWLVDDFDRKPVWPK